MDLRIRQETLILPYFLTSYFRPQQSCRPARADSYPTKAGWPFRVSTMLSPGSTMTIWAENFVREA